MPPLLLQPLVENAVRHGVEPDPAGGVIRVRTRVKRGHAVIDIVNSRADDPSQPGHGMALLNVRERLRLMHDVAAQFDARRDGDVFRVQIVVPLMSTARPHGSACLIVDDEELARLRLRHLVAECAEPERRRGRRGRRCARRRSPG